MPSISEDFSPASFMALRTAIEATVLAIGWLMGGTVGVGTVIYAVGIGPLVQLFLRLMPRSLLFHDFGAQGGTPRGTRNRAEGASITTMSECPQPEKTQSTVPAVKTC